MAAAAAAATRRPRQSGISHFIEHMVFKGTKNRSAERIAAEVDSIGGYMDAFTAKEYASFHLKVLDEHLPLAVEILGDIVHEPALRSRWRWPRRRRSSSKR